MRKYSAELKGKQKSIYAGLVSIASIEVLIFALFAFLIFSRKILELHNVFWGNLFITSISLLTFISFTLFTKHYKNTLALDRRGNSLFRNTLFFFFLGDLFWFGQETIFANVSLFEIMPDVAWNVGYISLICALFFFTYSTPRSSRTWTWVFVLLGLGAGIANIAINVHNDFSFDIYDANYFIQQLYPVYDFIALGLLLGLLAPLVLSRNLAFVKIYFWLFAIITRILFDNLFADRIIRGTYYTGNGIDLIYLLFYISVSISVVIRTKNLGGKQ